MDRMIVCPVFNEQKCIASLIERVRSMGKYTILVINDGSTDNTSKMLESSRPDFLINHNQNMGYGKSLIDGFNFATTNNYSYVVTIDGDLQHDATLIPIFFEKIKKCDIVLGSRYLHTPEHCKIEPPKSHFIYHRVITDIINETFKSSITDAFCGYRAYRVEKLRTLDLDIFGYGLAIQIIVQMLYKKLAFVELPVPMIYHNPVRERVPPAEKMRISLSILKTELQRIGSYDKKIFSEQITKWGLVIE